MTPNELNVVVQGTNVELTDHLREYVIEKVSDAVRPFGKLRADPAMKIVVEVEVDNRHHRKGEDVCRAEVNLTARGNLLRAEATADDIYKAITQMKHKLTREIRELRERKIKAARDGARSATSIADEDWAAGGGTLDPVDDWMEEDEPSA